MPDQPPSRVSRMENPYRSPHERNCDRKRPKPKPAVPNDPRFWWLANFMRVSAFLTGGILFIPFAFALFFLVVCLLLPPDPPNAPPETGAGYALVMILPALVLFGCPILFLIGGLLSVLVMNRWVVYVGRCWYSNALPPKE